MWLYLLSSLSFCSLPPLLIWSIPVPRIMSQYWSRRSPAKAATLYSECDAMDMGQLPLVDCPICAKHIIRLWSKKASSNGEFFFKCKDNEQDNPKGCNFFQVREGLQEMVGGKLW